MMPLCCWDVMTLIFSSEGICFSIGFAVNLLRNGRSDSCILHICKSCLGMCEHDSGFQAS